MENKKLSIEEAADLLKTLRNRFEKHPERHKGIEWNSIEAKLNDNPSKLWSVNEMEQTGGEPDVVIFSENSNDVYFVDCFAETPKNRRSICYDQEALEKRKEHKPANSAVNMAKEMGIELLDEAEYRELQNLGEFDLKTSSWIKTPREIREKGGAIFCDRRYNHVFTYHNGADSYYAVRGFRGKLKL